LKERAGQQGGEKRSDAASHARAAAGFGVFITQLTGRQDSFEVFPPKEEEFRSPGSAQMGDEKRLDTRAPVRLTGFRRFSSPC
jgi:hypothetical protein